MLDMIIQEFAGFIIYGKIDIYAAKLWGLTDKELRDIKISLKELSK